MANNIVLHQIHGISVGVSAKDGYVNATKACEAYQTATGKAKQPSDWLKTKRTEAYIAYVSTVRNIVRTELVITKQGGADEQGTWIHPDLAVSFGAWLSVEFEYQLTQWVNEWQKAKSEGKYPQNITGHIERSPERAALELIRDALDVGFARLAPEMRDGMYIEGAIALYPQLRPALEPFKPKLLLDAPLLSPTQIGELLTPPVSARAVNKLLAETGLQKATGEKNPAWEPIGKGLEYGQIVADTARGHGKTVQSCKWYGSVVELLKPGAR